MPTLPRRLRRPSAPAPAPPHAPASLAPLHRERLILHRLLAARGLPVPRLLGVVGPAGGHSALSGRPLPDLDAAAAFLESEAPAAFSVLPSDAAHPAAPRTFRREGGGLVGPGATVLAPASLARELRGGTADLHMVVAPLADPRGDGRVQVLALTTHVAAGGVVEVRTDPADHAPAPAHARAVALAAAAAPCLLPLRCLRWVVALTPEGPRLLDAAPSPSPAPTAPVAAPGVRGAVPVAGGRT